MIAREQDKKCVNGIGKCHAHQKFAMYQNVIIVHVEKRLWQQASSVDRSCMHFTWGGREVTGLAVSNENVRRKGEAHCVQKLIQFGKAELNLKNQLLHFV